MAVASERGMDLTIRHHLPAPNGFRCHITACLLRPPVAGLWPHTPPSFPKQHRQEPQDQPRRESWRREECLLLSGREETEQRWDMVLLGGLGKARQTASLLLPPQGPGPGERGAASGMTRIKEPEGQQPNRHLLGL